MTWARENWVVAKKVEAKAVRVKIKTGKVILYGNFMDFLMTRELAKKTKSVLITRDHHFANSIRFKVQDSEGIVYMRHGNLTAEEEIKLARKFLGAYSRQRFLGKLAIISKDGMRIR